MYSIPYDGLQRNRNDSLLFALALVTAAATFPLIFMGGLVTTHGAGMSVPDWPNSWGYNMFAFPYSKWVGGIWYEHTHRLAGATVGFLTLLVFARAMYVKQLRWTAGALVAAVCVQGSLGGLRVVLNDRDLAMVHGCAAQLFFAFAATMCVLTSRFWTYRPTVATTQLDSAKRVRTAGVVAVGAILMQLTIGAIMRHSDAGLAIPDFPTSFGGWLPPLHLDDAMRAGWIHQYGTELNLAHVTLFQIWIHFAHRLGATAVTIAVLWVTMLVFRHFRSNAVLVRPAILLLVLLATQVTLGILTVLWRKPADITSLHVAVGSLVLVTAWILLFRAGAMIRWSMESMSEAAERQRNDVELART